jgi:P-type Cu+ transporter
MDVMDVYEIPRQDDPAKECLTRLTMAIYGLGCGAGGSLAIERALRKVPGVEQVYVNPATEMAYIKYLTGVTHADKLVRAIEDAGFGAGEVGIR